MGNRITRSAKLRSCSLRLPTGCTEASTTVLAHAPCVEKGLGFKSPDWWAAYACSRCHDIVDGRVTDHGIPPAVIQGRWFKGVFETQKILFDEGILTINY